MVGCDCSGYYHSNSFDLKRRNFCIDKELIYWWTELYKHKNEHYPTTKIVSINPVGLKEIMDDDINII